MAADCYTNATLLRAEFATPLSKRKALFSQFSRKVHESLPSGPNTPPIVLTGGFVMYATINSALANGHAELIGTGRSTRLRT